MLWIGICEKIKPLCRSSARTPHRFGNDYKFAISIRHLPAKSRYADLAIVVPRTLQTGLPETRTSEHGGHSALPGETHGKMQKLARSERFELPTPRFEVWCSIQLSYERA
jgi:hypothetical protein